MSKTGYGAKTAVKTTVRSRFSLWKSIFQLLKEFWRSHPLGFLAMVALYIVGNVRFGIYITAMGGIVDSLVYGSAHGYSASFWILVYAGTSGVEQLFWALQPILFAYLNDHGAYRIQRRVMERATRVSLLRFEEKEFFDSLQRAAANMGERLMRLFGILLGLAGQELVGLCSVAVALAFVHPLLLPILLIGALPSLWLEARVATVTYRVQRAHTTSTRMRDLLGGLVTDKEAAGEIRLFGTAKYLIQRWKELRAGYGQDLLAAESRRTWARTLIGLIMACAYAGGLILVVRLILRGQLSVGRYVTVAAGALTFQDQISIIVQNLSSLEEESQFLGDLFDFLHNYLQEEGGYHPLGAGRSVVSTPADSDTGCRQGLSVEADGLEFTYPGSSVQAVRGISLKINPGERIAIVGENGAGKTTLVKLLLGLYPPDAGTVRFDGQSLTRDNVRKIRRRVAAVFQDFAHYQLTVRENIGFGKLEKFHDDGAILDAASKADMRELIEKLPDGIDSYVGRYFGSTDLSEGQWQRLALARAFFREADLVILDEPTAALDPLAELALFERFLELVKGRTAIMISHRLGAARLADRILVVRDGIIVEEGHHDQLVRQGGEYARLFSAQAQWYQ